MPSLPNTVGRQRAQAKYNAKPIQKKRRAQRNKTRRELERKGRVRKGDGKDIDHKDHNPYNQSTINLQVQDKHVNRRDGGPMAKALLSPRKRKKKK